MFNKEENIKDEIILMTLSEIVPKDHFLRKIDKVIDFKFIYDLTEKHYSHTSGRNIMDALEEAIKVTAKSPYRRTFHSDQGWAYQMKAYSKRLKEERIYQSMSRKANCLDNSVM